MSRSEINPTLERCGICDRLRKLLPRSGTGDPVMKLCGECAARLMALIVAEDRALLATIWKLAPEGPPLGTVLEPPDVFAWSAEANDFVREPVPTRPSNLVHQGSRFIESGDSERGFQWLVAGGRGEWNTSSFFIRSVMRVLLDRRVLAPSGAAALRSALVSN